MLCDPNEGGKHTFDEYFNYGCFVTSTPLTAPAVPGNSPRGILNGPPTTRVDFTLAKNFKVGEGKTLQLRGEAFNVLNHVNFTGFGTAASTPHSISATTGAHSGLGVVNGVRDPRTIQLAARFTF